MEVEVITIELNQLQGMIANAVAKGIQLAKQQDVVEDTYISVGEAREMLGRATNQSIISMCDRGILKSTAYFGKETKDGRKPKRTIIISKNSILKLLKNKR